MAMLTMLIFIFLIPKIQEPIHWIILVGIFVSVSKFDANYGISMLFL